jgi:uncharacterized protein (TIGR02271 family)
MFSQDDISRITGTDVYGTDGSKIGTAAQVYLDNSSGAPEWVSVKTGLFGTKESFVPLSDAKLSGDRIEVPYAKDQVKDAPQVDPDGDLSPAEEDRLYSHYGLLSSAGTTVGQGDTDSTTGRDTSGPTTDDAMTRSEERLNVGTERQEAGKARLRKYVVTERQEVNVPLEREEVRIEREPITDANVGKAMDGPAISEEEHEVTLHAERPVVETEAVPVERVRLGKETVTEQETVGGEVRKEQIDFADDPSRDRR